MSEARHDLETAPDLVTEQSAAVSDAMMMHAKELAGKRDLIQAFAIGDRDAARQAVVKESPLYDRPVLVGPDGSPWLGPTPDPDAFEATRRGEMPVEIVREDAGLARLALAPVMAGERWLGAAGWSSALDLAAAERLAGLTRSDVTIADRESRVLVTTLSDAPATALAAASQALPSDSVQTVEAITARSGWLAIRVPISREHTVIFSRRLDDVLTPLSGMRRSLISAGLVALGLALALAIVLTGAFIRPVRSLAEAVRGVEHGEFDAPVKRSSIREIDRLAVAFARMRTVLQERVRDLEKANESLAERQNRLKSLQAELIQRDRLTATARLATELAHEIRNPVASLKNCLEVVRRNVDNERAASFTDLALEELLRMHELAEQMLDFHRPRPNGGLVCDPAEVAREVRALVEAGDSGEQIKVRVRGSAMASVPPDTLKQILLNLVQNAREARPGGLIVDIDVEHRGDVVHVEVSDNGPGIDDEDLPKIYDPFFTTKGSVHGTGLGLYMVDGLVRHYGGRVTARNREDGEGLLVRLEFSGAPERAAVTATQSFGLPQGGGEP